MSKSIMLDIMLEVCKKRGIKLGEKFKIKPNNITKNNAEFYRIDEHGLEFYANGDWYITSGIEKILTGEVKIIKLPFVPHMGDYYFAVYEVDKVGKYVWRAYISDFQNYAFGNCFKTREEAEAVSKEIYSKLEDIYSNEKPLRKEK